jgi:hypothetical protein
MSESFPLMAIAKRFGVDYGDVLLEADWWRRLYDDDGGDWSHERDDQTGAAWARSRAQIKARGEYRKLIAAIRRHALQRWGGQ